MTNKLPDQVTQYFWGDSLMELAWEKHKNYIIQTLLEKADFQALQWLFQQTNQAEILSLLPSLRLSPKSANFWKVYLS